MKQLITARGLTLGETLAGTTDFIGLFGRGGDTSNELLTPWSVAGTFRNWKLKLSAAPGSGRTTTATLVHNGSDTALSIAIADPATSGEDLSDSVSVSAGDRLVGRLDYSGAGSTPQVNFTHHLEFESSAAGESGYCSAPGKSGSAWDSQSEWYAAFGFGTGGPIAWVSSATLADTYEDVVAVDGEITRYDALALNNLGNTPTAPGAGLGWNLVLLKNDVVQDGSGGTVDTRVTLQDSATTANWTGTLSVVKGDRIRVKATLVGTPFAVLSSLHLSVRLKATTDGQFQIAIRTVITTSAVRFNMAASISGWNATEANIEATNGPTTFYINDIVTKYRSDVGPNSWTITFRKNQATPFGTPYTTVVNASSVSGTWVFALALSTVSGTISVGNGDDWSLHSIGGIVPPPGCFGGGEITVVADPASGEVFTGRALAPRAWLTISFDDADRGLALDRQNDPPAYHGGTKLPYLVNIGSVFRQLSNRFSSYLMAHCTIEVDDRKRLFSTLEAASASEHWFNREARLYLASAATKAAQGTAHTLFRMIWTGHKSHGLRRTLQFTDILGSEFSDFNLEQKIPKDLIGDFFPDADDDIKLRVIPICYGTWSDKNEQSYVVPDTGAPTTGLKKPTNLTATVVGSAGTATHKYGVTAQSQKAKSMFDHSHETDAATVTVTNAPSASQMSPTRYVELDWDTVPGAYNYRIYGRDEGQPATGLELLDSARGPEHPGGPEERYNDGNPETDILKHGSHPPATNNTVVSGDPGSGGTTIVTDTGKGKITPIPVGLREMLDGTFMWGFLIAGHAGTHIEGKYLGGARIDDAAGARVLTPEDTNWASKVGSTPYVTINSRRMWMCFMPQGTEADAAIDGSVPLTLNLCGAEDVGDGSGRTIRAAARVVYHLIDKWVLQDSGTGNWPTAKLSGDGIPWLNSQSFSDAEDAEIDRIGDDGYEARIYLDEPLTVRQLLERILMSLDMRFGQNEHGQVIVRHLDEFADLASAVVLTHVHDIVDETNIDRALAELENHIDFDYDWRPADQTFEKSDYKEDTIAIGHNRSRPALGERRTLYYAGNDATALDVIGRQLAHGKYPPRYVKVVCTLHAVKVKLGDIVLATDVDGIGATGWTNRPLWVLGIDTLIGNLVKAPRVTLHCLDVNRLIGESGVLGSSAALVSWTSASEADKRKYMFLGDTATGTFSDGAPMKRLR